MLTPTLRLFYEQTLAKSIIALVFFGAAFMFLGFTSFYGGWTSYFAQFISANKPFSASGADMSTSEYMIKVLLINDASKIIPPWQGYGGFRL